ncbi:hypothetical protein BDZ91DRAFT_733636 [Kalaharituber pfeilii]|nr:hypothetical protein BDZ91DRAFT_733636 [Kalaharituber pfeilii]
MMMIETSLLLPLLIYPSPSGPLPPCGNRRSSVPQGPPSLSSSLIQAVMVPLSPLGSLI